MLPRHLAKIMIICGLFTCTGMRNISKNLLFCNTDSLKPQDGGVDFLKVSGSRDQISTLHNRLCTLKCCMTDST